MYGDLCRPEPIFLETGILPFATRILALEFIKDSLTQNSFTLAMDEHYALTLLLLVLLHHLNELLELVLQHIGIAQTVGII